MTTRTLRPEEARRTADPASLSFATTTEVEPIVGPIGQNRALDAVRFSAGIKQHGYNVFVLGPRGAGKHTATTNLLGALASRGHSPCDWAYVNNFRNPQRPRALRLDAGSAARLRDEMHAIIDDLKTALPALFESEEYRKRRLAVDQVFSDHQDQALDALRKRAKERGLALLSTQQGFTFAPLRRDKEEVVPPDEFRQLPDDERQRYIAAMQAMEKELGDLLFTLPRREKERRDQIRALNREIARVAVGDAMAEIKAHFPAQPPVLDYLRQVEADLIENADVFVTDAQTLPVAEGEAPSVVPPMRRGTLADPLRKYEVNVIVTHDPTRGAPVVYESHPILGSLVGRIEHRPFAGGFVTDFLLIRPGALHRANGGYLLLDAREALQAPAAWEALKRSLRAGMLRVESAGELFGMVNPVTLEPDPIPLDVKVVLFGDRWLYYALANGDPDFKDLFKVEADFSETVDRTPPNEREFARLISAVVRANKLRPFDRTGVARMLEESSRMADDSEKLSVMTGPVANLAREADYWAGQVNRDVVAGVDVQKAVAMTRERAGRVKEWQEEAILKGIFLIDTSGSKVGQINGLTVSDLGGVLFGRPARITARIRAGAGEVIDIEREVDLGGPIHSKGVMILSGYLTAHYAADWPLSFGASLAFEQSYGGVEGDSASMAELLALLSAITEVPLKQSLAITGSINQQGQSQVIGGINEKIEGFYDICAKRGLDGTHGIVLPAGNVRNLMLRPDIVEAMRAGKFSLHAVEHVDDAIALFTGMVAGERQRNGTFPRGSFNQVAAQRLRRYATRVLREPRQNRWWPW